MTTVKLFFFFVGIKDIITIQVGLLIIKDIVKKILL